MSKYGTRVNGHWATIAFRNKLVVPEGWRSYDVYVGEQRWGKVYQNSDHTWLAHSYAFSPADLVTGFATRNYAMWYIVQHWANHVAEESADEL
jgi:hypothetical protein